MNEDEIFALEQALQAAQEQHAAARARFEAERARLEEIALTNPTNQPPTALLDQRRREMGDAYHAVKRARRALDRARQRARIARLVEDQ